MSCAGRYVLILFKVSKFDDAPPIKSLIQFLTYFVVAICAVFVLGMGVGADGCPLKIGDIKLDLFKSKFANKVS